MAMSGRYLDHKEIQLVQDSRGVYQKLSSSHDVLLRKNRPFYA